MVTLTSATSDEVIKAHIDNLALTRARRAMPLIGAAVIGVLLANLSVFATFLVFNFILHWGS